MCKKVCQVRQKRNAFPHQCSTIFLYLKRFAAFYLEDNEITVIKQKGILIHPKAKHYIANETKEQHDFLVISQPAKNNDRTTIEQ